SAASEGPPQENEHRPPTRASIWHTGTSQASRWSPDETASHTRSIGCGYQRSCRIVRRSRNTASIGSVVIFGLRHLVEVGTEGVESLLPGAPALFGPSADVEK